MTNPRGASIGMFGNQQLLGQNPPQDLTAGYPVHRVTVWGQYDNGITWYKTDCGLEDATSGRLGRVYHALVAELCTTCWHAVPGVKGTPPAR